jgi:hypothetical protein
VTPNSDSENPPNSNTPPTSMTQLLTIHPKLSVSPTGLAVREVISFEEWAALAPQIGSAMRSMAFVIGDWINYGEEHFAPQENEDSGKIRQGFKAGHRARYRAAHAATNIDPAILHNYAYVSRRVKSSLRNELLSWEHHKTVAKLDPAEQARWLMIAASSQERVSSRRLRASISRGRLLSVDEMTSPAADQGIANHIVWINRLTSWWAKGKDEWLARRSHDQLEAILRDFAPVQQIINSIESRINAK